MKMVAPLEVGICCEDLDLLKLFYVQHLGFSEISTIHVPASKAGSTGLTTGAYQVLRLQSPWGERLKLLQPEHPPLRLPQESSILDRRGTTYLTFIVEDLQMMLARLQALGVPVLSGDRVVEVRQGVFLVFAKDPEGNILEFVKYAELNRYRPDLAATTTVRHGH